jgi:hypothetical protein
VSRPPSLTRFEILVLKNKSSTDPSQVPAAATIRFFQQGATYSGSSALPNPVPYGGPDVPNPPPPTAVPVFHVGRFQAGDQAQVDLDTSLILDVTAVDMANPVASVLYVRNLTVPNGIPIGVGARLLRKTNNTIVYPTAIPGTSSPVSFLTSNSTTGRAAGYVASLQFDYTVTGSGVTPRLHIDAVGSYVLRC